MPAHMRQKEFNLSLRHFSHSLKKSERLVVLVVANEGQTDVVLRCLAWQALCLCSTRLGHARLLEPAGI